MASQLPHKKRRASSDGDAPPKPPKLPSNNTNNNESVATPNNNNTAASAATANQETTIAASNQKAEKDAMAANEPSTDQQQPTAAASLKPPPPSTTANDSTATAMLPSTVTTSTTSAPRKDSAVSFEDEQQQPSKTSGDETVQRHKASFASDTTQTTNQTLTLRRSHSDTHLPQQQKQRVVPLKKRSDRKHSESTTSASLSFGGCGGVLLPPPPARKTPSNDLTASSLPPLGDLGATLPESSALDHLDAIQQRKDDHSDETFASSGHKLLMEAIMYSESTATAAIRQDNTNTRDRSDSLAAPRERLDSFIGRRSRLESWGGMSDLSAAGQLLGDLGGGDTTIDSSTRQQQQPNAIPSGIMVARDRLNSLASLGDLSVGQFGEDIQAYVAAAMETVGDQLHDLASVVENVAAAAMSLDKLDSESVHSPLIGAMQEAQQRPRAHSVGSDQAIPISIAAVQAAVDAAEAATGPMGMTDRKRPASSLTSRYARRHLPKRDRTGSSGTTSTLTDDAKATQNKPLKKRRKNPPPPAFSNMATPRIANKASKKAVLPDEAKSSGKPKKATPAIAKWDGMLDCLYDYINEKRVEETSGMTEEERSSWVWDGNVPTSFKTQNGKNLGRWVNNQRTSKAKGSLKKDREERLTKAGLKWSVVNANCWEKMLRELKIYVKEQERNGKKWDGNVPTNYQIKSSDNGEFKGEDKNLGRWVNRQRSLYQAGRLKKDRQTSLETLGLKWSMLQLTSWEEMFESLKVYVENHKKTIGEWDGNVPASFRTDDHQPRNLGRWVNRQRSAYLKNKLKKEQADLLDGLGLKWTINQRPEDAQSENDGPDNVPSNIDVSIKEQAIAI